MEMQQFCQWQGVEPRQRGQEHPVWGDVQSRGNGYLSVYGFMKAPKVEYHVVEIWGTYDPALQFGSAGKMLKADGEEGTRLALGGWCRGRWARRFGRRHGR